MMSAVPGVAGDWRVGVKRAFELFPGGLKARSKQERRKRWSKYQREAVTASLQQASALQAKQSQKVLRQP